MYARVVRFTDVQPERFEQREGEGPPEGTSAKAIQVWHDSAQGTAVVVQLFDTEEDMKANEAAFDQMDPSDTPGTRASVDRCELRFEVGD